MISDKILEELKIFKDSKKSELTTLTKPPKKDKGEEIPTHKALIKDSIQQGDLLFLPEDKGYKYLLVVVDVATKAADAEPLKNKESKTVLKALKRIWKRKYLNPPSVIFKTDDGKEFKGYVKKYFESSDNATLKNSRVARHRQTAVVEALNKTLGRIIALKQKNFELIHKQENKEWVETIPQIMKLYNEIILKRPKIGIKEFFKMPYIPKDILKRGDLVKIILDYPQNIDGKRLHGTFRTGDFRYDNNKLRKIEGVLITPGQPPIYTIEGIDNTGYTRNQLLYNPEEQDKPEEIEDNKRYEVEKITGEKKIKNKKYYRIKWKGYKEQTYEEAKRINSQVPDLVKKYKKKL